jgi:polyhydroxyalkanoate synthesis regulator phasin
MTAEVAVLNSIGVALAADSAVTVSIEAGKIYTSADKLFQLSTNAPVGVMVHGNASFLGVPWETIIKCYRTKLGSKTFPHLKEYSNDFIQYLKISRNLFPAESQKDEIHSIAYGYYNFVLEKLKKLVKEEYDKGNQLNESQVKRFFSDLVKRELIKTQESQLLQGMSPRLVTKIGGLYTRDIKTVQRKVFEKLPMSQITKERLTKIIVEIATRERLLQRERHAGVVVAGFGDDEHFPQLNEHVLLSMLGGYPLYSEGHQASISGGREAIVVPLAQREMVMTFMEGVDPKLRKNIEGSTKDLFQAMAEIIIKEVKKKYPQYGTKLKKNVMPGIDKLLDKLYNYWKDVQRKEYSDPVMEMVASLPKDELGTMAESLVSLTKFKRRISREQETVGGPVDVAVITKGDGFVWMKRKHYFAPEINPRYVARITKWSK